ncbi:hypothetical protein [Pseudooceanicola aestuarii]|uniref:hypothetical protein n=1 Tax=Pseudooceanicola aestuarii TaxID=2697319 RepID=UPI0013D8014F|nr:hypothetical protein [Pseudooceanicola aestuarii]
MEVVIHAGVHATDEDRLVKCLLRNKEKFLETGVATPGPSRYRQLLRDAMVAVERGAVEPGAREVLLDAIMEQDHVNRLLLSSENFFCNPKLAISGDRFYHRAERRLADFCTLFAGDEVELFLAIRDPGTFIPAIFAASPEEDFPTFLQDTDPTRLRWSELITRLRDNLPNVALTVWCNEDTPLIWAALVREIAAQDPDAQVLGGYDILREIMSREGMRRFRAYIDTHPDLTERQKRRVIAAFLDKYAEEDKIAEEVDLPGWDDTMMDVLAEIYEEDVDAIERMDGVTFIAP